MGPSRAHSRQSSPGNPPSWAPPRKSSPSNPPSWALPRKSSPSTPKNADFRPFWVRRANYFALTPITSHAGRTLYRIQGRCRYKTLPARSPAAAPGTKLSRHTRNTHFRRILRQQGEFYTASTTTKPSRAKKVTHQHPTSPQQHTPPPIPHVIRLHEISTTPRNVAIPTNTIQILK